MGDTADLPGWMADIIYDCEWEEQRKAELEAAMDAKPLTDREHLKDDRRVTIMLFHTFGDASRAARVSR